MNLSYSLLLNNISKEQGLGLKWNEIPLIIETTIITFTLAYLTYEDDKNLIIITPGENGEEYAKIVNKDTILVISLVYQQMFETDEKIEESKEVI